MKEKRRIQNIGLINYSSSDKNKIDKAPNFKANCHMIIKNSCIDHPVCKQTSPCSVIIDLAKSVAKKMAIGSNAVEESNISAIIPFRRDPWHINMLVVDKKTQLAKQLEEVDSEDELRRAIDGAITDQGTEKLTQARLDRLCMTGT